MKGFTRDDFKDGDIIWLEGKELDIAYAWMMSMKSGMSSVDIDYDFTKDFCAKNDLDSVDIYGLFRRMAAELSAKK